MELRFDIRGDLTPYERTELSMNDFEENFVNSFDIDSTRKKIFQKYQNFIKDFKKEVTPNFTYWINGSFTTNKKNPKDIDFITLINSENYESNRELIGEKFTLTKGKEIYGVEVDAYTIEVYPENHEKHFYTRSDLVHWDNFFSRTKKNRKNLSFSKGYIEIKFNSIDDLESSIVTE